MLDFLLGILRWKRVIIVTTITGIIISVAVALLLPKEYITIASVRGSGGGQGFNISSLMKGGGLSSNFGSFLDLASSGRSGETDYYMAILKSRTVLDSVVYKFKLKDRYETKTFEDARELLKVNTEIERNAPAEIVSFGVYDKDPKTAYELTSYYVLLLNQIYSKLSSEAARNTRQHLEKRYNDALSELTSAEDTLRRFQEKYGVYDIYAQTEAAIKSAATLKSNIVLQEVEYAVKSGIFGETTPEINLLRKELEELNEKYAQLIKGSDKPKDLDVILPFKEVPSLGLAYYRLYRNVQVYNELVKVLLPLLEQSKIQELRETPNILVLDQPIIPEKKSKPKRMLIVLGGTLFFFLIGFLYAFMKENLRSLKENNPEKYNKVLEVSKSLMKF